MSFILSKYDHYWKQTQVLQSWEFNLLNRWKKFHNLKTVISSRQKEKKRKTVCVSVCIFQYQGKSIFNWPALRQTPNCRRNILSINWPRTWKKLTDALNNFTILKNTNVKKNTFQNHQKRRKLLAKEIRFFFNEFKDLFMCVNSLHCFWFELKGFFYSNDVASKQAVSTVLH